jgi:hypothetical protein
MIRYLYEKKTGQSHQFAAKNEERGGSDTSTSGKSHWEEWKYWYIGGGILVLIVGLGVAFWNKLIGSTGKDE